MCLCVCGQVHGGHLTAAASPSQLLSAHAGPGLAVSLAVPVWWLMFTLTSCVYMFMTSLPVLFFFSILGILKETKSKLSTPLFWRPAASLRFCKFRFVFPPLTLWHKTRHLFGLHTSSHNYFGSPLFRLLMDNRIQRIPENTFHSLWKLAELWVTFSEGSGFWYW